METFVILCSISVITNLSIIKYFISSTNKNTKIYFPFLDLNIVECFCNNIVETWDNEDKC